MSHELEETTNPGATPHVADSVPGSAALSSGAGAGFDHAEDEREGTEEVTQVDAPEHSSAADVGTPADFDDSVLDDIAVPSV